MHTVRAARGELPPLKPQLTRALPVSCLKRLVMSSCLFTEASMPTLRWPIGMYRRYLPSAPQAPRLLISRRQAECELRFGLGIVGAEGRSTICLSVRYVAV